MGELSWWHWLIVIGVAVVLFGAKRLPDAARSLGQSTRILKAELRADSHPDTPATPPAAPVPPASPQAAAGPQPAADAPPPPADRGPARNLTAALRGENDSEVAPGCSA